MQTRPWIAGMALAGVLLGLGCVPEERFKRIETEVGDLKVEVFKLRSQIEEANRKGDEDRTASAEGRTQDRRFQADLQETMRQLQDSTRILSNRLGDSTIRNRAMAKPAEAPRPEAAPAANDEDKAFNAALLDYNRGNYPLAFDGMDLFVKSNPQSPRRAEAVFYMGLCAYNQKAFDKAKPLFEQVLKDFPNSERFLPAKLKRAQCLHRMGLKPAAIKAYKEIMDAFNGSAEARTAQQELNDLGL